MGMPNVDALATAIDELDIYEYMEACNTMISFDSHSFVQKLSQHLGALNPRNLKDQQERERVLEMAGNFLQNIIIT